MNWKYITAKAGKKTAESIYHCYNDMKYRQIDPETLDDIMRGGVVLGVETIDAPDIDGMILYIKRPAGDVLCIAFDVTDDGLMTARTAPA